MTPDTVQWAYKESNNNNIDPSRSQPARTCVRVVASATRVVEHQIDQLIVDKAAVVGLVARNV